jgi:hypothetical protein
MRLLEHSRPCCCHCVINGRDTLRLEDEQLAVPTRNDKSCDSSSTSYDSRKCGIDKRIAVFSCLINDENLDSLGWHPQL